MREQGAREQGARKQGARKQGAREQSVGLAHEPRRESAAGRVLAASGSLPGPQAFWLPLAGAAA